MSKSLITLIIPVHNGDSTLEKTFQSLESQNDKQLIQEIIIINDNSADKSYSIIQHYIKASSFNVQCIEHQQSAGLAASYNEAIKLSQSEYFILMHQDICLPDVDCFEKMLEPFSNENTIASYPVILHPHEVWKGYGFWQKCLFSRFVEKEKSALNGKFDCFHKERLMNLIGLFDEEHYRTAGEDLDLEYRILRAAYQTAASSVKIHHIHEQHDNFSLKKTYHKEAQLAESQGVLLRKYAVVNFSDLLTYFRPLLIVALIFPYLQMISILFIMVYSFLYTKRVYLENYQDWRIVLLPFINVSLLLVATFYTFKGFIRGKQTL